MIILIYFIQVIYTKILKFITYIQMNEFICNMKNLDTMSYVDFLKQILP